ncbi:MAG TPA: alpha-amylase family glycosyl hydrolase, partial [Stenomitos sp.]
AWWGYKDLPKFNTDTPAVRRYLLDAARYWIEQGADGWRLDVPNEIDNDDFWRTFRAKAKAINPNAYITGEIWNEADRWLQGDQFDSVMNYPLRNAMMGFFNGGYNGPVGDHVPALNVDQFESWINGLRNKYDPEISYAQFNLISSHDVERFASIVGGDFDRLKLAVTFQMTYPGAPVVYYGDEVGMTGSKDPDNRQCFPTDSSRYNMDVLNHYKTMIGLRNSLSALRTGSFRGLRRHNDLGLYAYVREDKQNKVVVMLNNSNANRQWDLDVSSVYADGTPLKDALTGQSYTVKGGDVPLTLRPKQGLVLIATGNRGK